MRFVKTGHSCAATIHLPKEKMKMILRTVYLIKKQGLEKTCANFMRKLDIGNNDTLTVSLLFCTMDYIIR